MTKRLEIISSYIEEGEKVLDVGCDQALLSIILAKRKIYSIASDLRLNIIENAQKKISDDLKKYITFRIGDGITLTKNETDYTLVLAGMGTHLILEIIKNYKGKFNKIITISNNNHDILRKNMLELGYIINLERIIKEKGKYYNLIIFIPGTTTYTEEELLIGIKHQNLLLLKEKNELLINKYHNILYNIKEEKNKKDLQRKINILENYKYKEQK